jgi:hypothetical protein
MISRIVPIRIVSRTTMSFVLPALVPSTHLWIISGENAHAIVESVNKLLRDVIAVLVSVIKSTFHPVDAVVDNVFNVGEICPALAEVVRTARASKDSCVRRVEVDE